jgi:hypothetical protein
VSFLAPTKFGYCRGQKGKKNRGCTRINADFDRGVSLIDGCADKEHRASKGSPAKTGFAYEYPRSLTMQASRKDVVISLLFWSDAILTDHTQRNIRVNPRASAVP